MNIQFATCQRHRALGFIRAVYPDRAIDDAGATQALLDLVEADVVRVQDPMMHACNGQIAVIPGDKWDDSRLAEVQQIGAAFLASVT